MFYLLCIAIGFGLLNRCRGNDFYGYITTRWQSFAIIAALYASVALLLTQDPLIATVIAAGTSLWASFGWGKYFMSITGRPTDGGSIGIVDWLTNKIVGKAGYSNAKLWGTVGFGLRGGLVDAPMWLALAYLISPLCLFGLAFSFCQGIVYYLSGIIIKETEGPVTYAEIVFGGLRAFLLFAFIGG